MTQDLEDSAAPLLKLSGVGKVYRSGGVETEALSGVHLEIRRGEYVAIEGPSGSGKTTLLSILGLLDAPSSGSYTIRGRPVGSLRERQRAELRNREIGFIFQSFNLIGELSVWENVELPLSYGGLSAPDRAQRVERALERVQMLHRRRHLPHQLSGGQQQRVAVARAVAGDPAILLADEPTGSLDSSSGELVMQLLDELFASGSTICMVSHNRDYCHRAGRLIHLFDGRVVDDTAPAG